MKKLLITLSLLVAVAEAYGSRWYTMRNTGTQTIDFTLRYCYYKATFGDLSIKFVYDQGLCPMFIEYNPMTGQWRR